jgi:hypothetical protein
MENTNGNVLKHIRVGGVEATIWKNAYKTVALGGSRGDPLADNIMLEILDEK